MYNNPGPRKPERPALEGLEARFNALPAWGRYGLIAADALFVIVMAIIFVSLLGEAVSVPTPAIAQIATPVPSSPVVPTPMPTLAPTPTSTPEPTQPPAQQSTQQQQPSQQQPAPAQLFITFTGASAVDKSYGSVSVHTLPGAALTIKIQYCTRSYATTGQLQGTRQADSAGDYTWTWTPDTKCRGTATAYVNASLDGQSTSNSTNFPVS